MREKKTRIIREIMLVMLLVSSLLMPSMARAEVESGIQGDAPDAEVSQELEGVDVSDHDGTVDWDALKEYGIDFAIIRCGYGGMEDANDTQRDDDQFERNVSECERLGIPYGIYLYSYATEPYEHAVIEANHVVRMAQTCNPTLGIWYDVEEPRQARAIGNDWSNYDTLITTFRDIVEGQTGYKVGLYASLSYFKTYLSSETASSFPHWLAQWSSSPAKGYDHVMWQSGSKVIAGHRFDYDVADSLPEMTLASNTESGPLGTIGNVSVSVSNGSVASVPVAEVMMLIVIPSIAIVSMGGVLVMRKRGWHSVSVLIPSMANVTEVPSPVARQHAHRIDVRTDGKDAKPSDETVYVSYDQLFG